MNDRPAPIALGNNDEEELLVRVGPGTPSGEVFRRYWLPVEVSANLGMGRGAFSGARNPIRVRVLGEDLVLFRDASGRPGLLAEHCSHRGTSLYFGRVEESCLRCLYHGWAYDREGNVVDTPAEPPDSTFKQTVKHLAYPCIEVAGLIFAYLGPPDLQPPFPHYHQLFATGGIRVTGNGGYVEQCNVFQALHDNNLDPWHGEIAHGWYRGRPPEMTMHHGQNGEPPTPIRFERTPWGTRMVVVKSSKKPGKYWYHETHTVWPSQRCNFQNARSIKWAMPVDDYRTRWFTVDYFPFDENGQPTEEALRAMNSRQFNIGWAPEGMPDDWAEQVGAWWNLGHPWRQGNVWEDEVAQKTQGPPERHFLPEWEKWHLASSDRGMVLNRRVWREQVQRVREGLDPIGIFRNGQGEAIIRITSDDIHGVDWDTGMQFYNMSVEERLRWIEEEEKLPPHERIPRGSSAS